MSTPYNRMWQSFSQAVQPTAAQTPDPNNPYSVARANNINAGLALQNTPIPTIVPGSPQYYAQIEAQQTAAREAQQARRTAMLAATPQFQEEQQRQQRALIEAEAEQREAQRVAQQEEQRVAQEEAQRASQNEDRRWEHLRNLSRSATPETRRRIRWSFRPDWSEVPVDATPEEEEAYITFADNDLNQQNAGDPNNITSTSFREESASRRALIELLRARGTSEEELRRIDQRMLMPSWNRTRGRRPVESFETLPASAFVSQANIPQPAATPDAPSQQNTASIQNPRHQAVQAVFSETSAPTAPTPTVSASASASAPAAAHREMTPPEYTAARRRLNQNRFSNPEEWRRSRAADIEAVSQIYPRWAQSNIEEVVSAYPPGTDYGSVLSRGAPSTDPSNTPGTAEYQARWYPTRAQLRGQRELQAAETFENAGRGIYGDAGSAPTRLNAAPVSAPLPAEPVRSARMQRALDTANRVREERLRSDIRNYSHHEASSPRSSYEENVHYALESPYNLRMETPYRAEPPSVLQMLNEERGQMPTAYLPQRRHHRTNPYESILRYFGPQRFSPDRYYEEEN